MTPMEFSRIDESLLAEIVDEYTERLHRGEAADPEVYAARYPSLATTLRQILSAINALALPLSSAADSAVTPSAARLRTDLRNAARPAGSMDDIYAERDRIQKGMPQYEILDVLGSGGMGTIFLARHTELERYVAIKVVRTDLRLTSSILNRFRMESRAIASLAHPNIVQIYEVGMIENMPWIALEYCSGGSLAVNQNHLLRPPVEAARLMVTVASAVHAAHEAGLIHRDLKPANILLTQSGEPKVSDFGLVKLVNDDTETTRAGTVLGTPSYMSPEQTLGDSSLISRAADIYSLGAILYDLLTGRPPFRAASLMQTIDQVRHREPLRPQHLNSAVPRDLETICLKCLRKSPEERYLSAAALADDLQAFLDFRPICARRVTIAERIYRYARRSPAQTISVCLLIIAIVSGIGGIWWFEKQARAAADRQRQISEAEGLADAILNAEINQLPGLLQRIDAYAGAVETRLKNSLQTLKFPDDDNSLRNCAIALSFSEPDQADYLWERFPFLTPVEVMVYSKVLAPPNTDFLNRCLKVLTEDTTPQFSMASEQPRSAPLRLRAAGFAAQCLPAAGDWTDALADPDLTAELVQVSPAEFGEWRSLLNPVLPQMIVPLEEMISNPDSAAQSRLFAFDLLVELAKSDTKRLFGLLLKADESQFPIVLRKLQRTPDEAALSAIEFLEQSRVNPAGTSHTQDTSHLSEPSRREEAARRTTRAAALLIHLQRDQIVWPLLSRSDDPTVRFQMIQQFPGLRINPLQLWQRFQLESDHGTRFALLLCLGGYSKELLPSNLTQDGPEKLYELITRNQDPGVSSAARWLLRKWRSETPTPENDRFMDAVDHAAALMESPSPDCRGFINRERQPFVIIEAESFPMGSPENLISRDPDEVLHLRAIRRRYAMAMYEVTAAEYRRFRSLTNSGESDDSADLEQFADDEPIGGISWYDAAAYCNWLSQQDNIPPDQWCYEPAADNQYAAGMRVRENFLNLSGYRLPTEPEWEFACRAGTNSSRFCGESESILSQYAWYSPVASDRAHTVGLLRPNDFGLFDMLGNRYEWCHEVFRPYSEHPSALLKESPQGQNTWVISDEHSGETVNDVDRRVVRGGSFDFSARHARSAYRTNDLASDRIRNNGLRPVRTWTAPDQ